MNVKQEIQKLIKGIIDVDNIELSIPPKSDMGDFAFACYELAKKEGKNPAELAQYIVDNIDTTQSDLVDDVKAFGPYVNFFLNEQTFATIVFNTLHEKREQYGSHDIGEGKLYMVEYACPNPMKAFHLGHLKNLITGESVARVLDNAGYKVMRVNYQGDVGMHIAKVLWGIFDWKDQFNAMKDASIRERVEFLGKAYAHGAQHFEEDEAGKQDVIAYNDKVYEKDASIWDVYEEARTWSLAYFDTIYERLDSCFDRFYFESEMYERGVEIVQEFVKKDIFKESEGAIIFPGSEYGLHDRVFINSKGFPTYEAKDLALSEHRFKEFNPEKIIHIVGKEQMQYFQVIFKALEFTNPESKGKEFHLPGGFLQLKGDQKMSSRKGNIITGDALLDMVQNRVQDLMKESEIEDRDTIVEHVTVAALKYAMLKADITKDVAFDLEESISTSGDSGPYLLYIVARINRIIEKAGTQNLDISIPVKLHTSEKELLTMLMQYPAITLAAAESLDPSKIARFLFDMAKAFNGFYDNCPVLDADDEHKAFRLQLIAYTRQIMVHGLTILGIKPVSQM